MRNQVWYVATLLGIMCLIRFGLSAIGYVDPPWLMQQLGVPVDSNLQMPYIIRVWAIRDMVLAILVVFSNQATIKVLLFACIAIDMTDIWSAHLSGLEGLFSETDTWSLKLTAIAALLPESIALALIMRNSSQTQE
ncbi:hypothetical protein B9G53_16330 [Pseudanabaena sp. SR411]|uniref:hypothetical protein n=1 Tax=Pseudanabaena sp. SR411 TaxID=1980935 RepID=UPI000B97E44F|nr:hypothetical protein [Pseudanabaena sp. SR411]OYQ63544.1 hypothetical protein B9G53_16330 [Pseudanabaena sp. SR411]